MRRIVGNCNFYMTEAGSDVGVYDALDGTYVFCRGDLTEGDLESYLSELSAEGFETIRRESLGNNEYYCLAGKDADAYLSYLRDASELRVYAEPKGFSKLPPAKNGEAGDGDTVLIQLTVDNIVDRANGGMTYALRLSDGRFVLIDGGYYSDDEADRIYSILKKYTPEGQRPHIAAWFLTHFHGDHYGGMIRFAEKYAKECKLDGYYFNGLRNGRAGWHGMIDKFAVLRDMWSTPPEIYGKIHSGMTLEFSGVPIRVMCTHEDVYPKNFIDANDMGSVLRIDACSQRIMMLGDCRDTECDAMIKAFEGCGELKSDMVQYSHHGYEGATKQFYEAVDAETVLFPMNIVGWQENYKTVPQNVFAQWFVTARLPAKDYLADYMARGNIKKVIVAGAGIAELTLPYKPEGEVILDYAAYFEEHKHEVPKGIELKGYRYTDETKTKIERIEQ